MLNIDGGKKSGSGTILRLSVALAAILNEPLSIYNIRQKRPQPGLKPQHLAAVLTAAKLCKATVKGAKVGSRELSFYPSEILGGKIDTRIGTAGSIPMLLMTVLPICAFAENPTHIRISKGGTDVSYSPTINYVDNVLLPILARMGLRASLTIHKYGYYPKGLGEVSLDVIPCPKLAPLRLEEFGQVKSLNGVSVSTFLADRKVAKRQAKAASLFLAKKGYEAHIQVINDFSNPAQKGSSITLWASTTSNTRLGGDAIGKLGKPAETVGKEAARNLLQEIEAKATVDVHLADMLVPYFALAEGNSAFLTRSLTDHLETNMWLTSEILGVKFETSRVKHLIRTEKRPK